MLYAETLLQKIAFFTRKLSTSEYENVLPDQCGEYSVSPTTHQQIFFYPNILLYFSIDKNILSKMPFFPIIFSRVILTHARAIHEIQSFDKSNFCLSTSMRTCRIHLKDTVT